MVEKIIIVPILLSFLATLLLVPFWIRKAREIGMTWEDMNKKDKPKVSGAGGMIVVFGFIVGVFSFIALNVFVFVGEDRTIINALAAVSSVLFLSFIGFVDDLFGWKRGGLTRTSRIILVLFASIPLVVISAGRKALTIPFLGGIELGIIYPLLFIPLGIIGATTTFNFLAGFNGLEAGNGIIIISGLSIFAYIGGNSWLAVLGLCMIAPLFAFLIFNFSPAKILPGDILTYSVGGLIAIIAILGGLEKIAVFFFIPVIAEVILKVRGKLVKQSFGEPQEDDSLKLKYEKIYSLNHLAIYLMNKFGIRATERKVVVSIWMLYVVFVVAGFLIF